MNLAPLIAPAVAVVALASVYSGYLMGKRAVETRIAEAAERDNYLSVRGAIIWPVLNEAYYEMLIAREIERRRKEIRKGERHLHAIPREMM